MPQSIILLLLSTSGFLLVFKTMQRAGEGRAGCVVRGGGGGELSACVNLLTQQVTHVLPFPGNFVSMLSQGNTCTTSTAAPQINKVSCICRVLNAGLGTLLGRSRSAPTVINLQRDPRYHGHQDCDTECRCTNVYGGWAPSFPDSFPFQLQLLCVSVYVCALSHSDDE